MDRQWDMRIDISYVELQVALFKSRGREWTKVFLLLAGSVCILIYFRLYIWIVVLVVAELALPVWRWFVQRHERRTGLHCDLTVGEAGVRSTTAETSTMTCWSDIRALHKERTWWFLELPKNRFLPLALDQLDDGGKRFVEQMVSGSGPKAERTTK